MKIKFTEYRLPASFLTLLKNENSLPDIASPAQFHEAAMELFDHQYRNNAVYHAWVDQLGVDSNSVRELHHIPFLPASFFKKHTVVTGELPENPLVFTSSGTTGSVPARHFVKDPTFYRESFVKGFRQFYGDPSDYCMLALLPGYLERSGSSLVYMMDELIRLSAHPYSGFYLREHKKLLNVLDGLRQSKQKTILLGVSYALLDLCTHRPQLGENVIVMETGGMKGTRKEMLRPELHEALKTGLGIDRVHSEYGMTELLSQAYSKGDGFFESPPWMRFLLRETDDPLSAVRGKRTGGVNVIDLANRNSCAFIATQDLGRIHPGNKLELMGRFDHSDVRGCNLMLQGL